MADGNELLLQLVAGPGAVDCEALSGLPGSSPALVVLAPASSPAAESGAQTLADALRTMLRAAGAGGAVTPACGGGQQPVRGCRAHGDATVRKLLVLIGDRVVQLSSDTTSLLAWWLAQGPEYAVLPMLPRGASPDTQLPQAARPLNVSWWDSTPADRVDDVIALAGLTPADRRVFISYRRQDALEIAEQLFEELEKHRFDVFVDRFRIEPGRDFQERLTDELAHASMVLVLESPTIRQSRWIEHELQFAKAHALGHLAVSLPGAVNVPWLDDEYRVRVDPAALVPPLAKGSSKVVDATHRLSAAALAAVLSQLVTEHTRALLRRRAVLVDAVRVALTRRGVTEQRLDASGYLHITVQKSGAASRRYVIWATPRPPGVEEFRVAHGVCDPGPEPVGVVIAPALYRESRRRGQSLWLAERSLVRLQDAGQIETLADRIAAAKDIV